jgi:hypothetical protein
MADFLNVMEHENDMSSVKDELRTPVLLLKKLQAGEKEDWTGAQLFNQALELLGDYPPVALVKALGDHYAAKERRLEEHDIPAILQQYGLESCKLDDGTKVTIQRRYSASVQDEAQFLAWFEAEGYADLLKTVLEFRRGDVDADLKKELETRGLSYKESFAKAGFPQVLGKVVRERIEAGEKLPSSDVLKVTIMETAKVKD